MIPRLELALTGCTVNEKMTFDLLELVEYEIAGSHGLQMQCICEQHLHGVSCSRSYVLMKMNGKWEF